MARHLCRTAKQFSRTVTRGRWQQLDSVLLSGSFGRLLNRVRRSTFSPTRHGHFCRVPGLPHGSCSVMASKRRLITDGMAGHFLKSGRIGCVIVGADRIAANGDVANKVGTYGVAVLARENGVPFYVAAPISTLDLSLSSGDSIPIEERASKEVTQMQGVTIAPEGINVANPAFDVTPHRYISAIITERGVARAPFLESLRSLKAPKSLRPRLVVPRLFRSPGEPRARRLWASIRSAEPHPGHSGEGLAAVATGPSLSSLLRA